MRARLLALAFLASMIAVPSFAANRVLGSFDGFCDGFDLKLKGNGSASGKMTGCESGVIAGAFTNTQIIYAPQTNPPVLYIINESPRTFLIYNHKGKIILQGTWSPGFPLEKSSSPSTANAEE